MNDLAAKSCVPCRGGVPPPDSCRDLSSIGSAWGLASDRPPPSGAVLDLSRFSNRTGLCQSSGPGRLAEEQGHHPDLYLAWGRVGITIWTHKIDGLTESDFVLAAKIDRIQASD